MSAKKKAAPIARSGELQLELAKMADRFGYLANRWADECEYEPFADYETDIKKYLPFGATFLFFTKRPFRIVFDCDDGYRRYMRASRSGSNVEWGIFRKPSDVITPARTLADYEACIIDGAGRTSTHRDFDPTVEGPHWKRK